MKQKTKVKVSKETKKMMKDFTKSIGGKRELVIAAGKGVYEAVKEKVDENKLYKYAHDEMTINCEILKLGIELGILTKTDEDRFLRTYMDVGSIVLDRDNMKLSYGARVLLYTKRICGMALTSEEDEKELYYRFLKGERVKG